MLNGSARNDMSTRSEPTGSHENRSTTSWRSSSGRPRRSKNAPTVTANEPTIIAVAK